MFLEYIEQHIMPVLGNRPTLFTFDLCPLLKTPAVLDSLSRYNIVSRLILGGYTSFIQPIGISINKPPKACICDLTDEPIFDCENLKVVEKWTMGVRKILTTWCVGDA